MVKTNKKHLAIFIIISLMIGYPIIFFLTQKNGYYYEQFELIADFTQRSNFEFIHPLIFIDGNVTPAMQNFQVVNLLEETEYINYKFITLNNTTFLKIEGYALKVHLYNKFELPNVRDKVAHEKYLFRHDFAENLPDQYLFISIDPGNLTRFNSRFEALTNFCGAGWGIGPGYDRWDIGEVTLHEGWNDVNKQGSLFSCA